MSKWFFVRADGTVAAATFAKPKPSLQEMQEAVGGYVERVQLDGRTYIWANEEGLLHGLPLNRIATRLYQAKYGLNVSIVGDALFESQGVKPTSFGAELLAYLEDIVTQESRAASEPLADSTDAGV